MRLGAKLAIALVLFVAVVLGVLYYFSPHLTARAMGKAAEARDAATLSSYIDFSKLREQLKGDARQRLTAELGKAAPKEDNPLASILGKALGGPVIDALVDQFVSPQSVEDFLKDQRPMAEKIGDLKGKMGKAPGASGPGSRPAAPAEPKAGEPKDLKAPLKDELDVSYGYETMDRFVLAVKKKGTSDKPLEAVLTRAGPFSWRLTGLRNLL